MRALVKLEQVLPAHLRRRVSALGSATIAPAGRRPDRRPAAPDRDRRRLPRLRVPALRLPQPRRHRQPPRGRAARARQPRPALVPRRLGPRPRGLAHLPRRPARAAGRRPACASRRARCRPRTPPRTSQQSIARRAEPLRGAGDAARAARTRSRAASPRYWGTIEPIDDAHAASTAPATTTSAGWRCAIAMLGVDFEVHEPPELVEHLRGAGRAARRAPSPRPADQYGPRHACKGPAFGSAKELALRGRSRCGRGGQRERAALGVPAYGPPIAGVDDRAAELADALERRGQVRDGEVGKGGGVAGTGSTIVDSEAQVVGVGLPPGSGRGGPWREGDPEHSVPEPPGAIGIVGREFDQWRGHATKYGALVPRRAPAVPRRRNYRYRFDS